MSIPIFTAGRAGSRNHDLEARTFHTLKELARELKLNSHTLLRNQNALRAVADSEYVDLNLYILQIDRGTFGPPREYKRILTEMFLVSPEAGELAIDTEKGVVFEQTGEPIISYDKEIYPPIPKSERAVLEYPNESSLRKLGSLNITRKYALPQEPHGAPLMFCKFIRPSLRLVENGDFARWFDVPILEEDPIL